MHSGWRIFVMQIFAETAGRGVERAGWNGEQRRVEMDGGEGASEGEGNRADRKGRS